MDLIIMHYHFRAGGVTDVIQKSVSTLVHTDIDSIVLACGEEESQVRISQDVLAHPKVTLHTEPALAYSENISPPHTEEELHTALLAFFTRISTPHTVWWVHNHHLGKNPLFTKTLMEYLYAHNTPCILQIHDFPEAARYTNLVALQNILPLARAYTYTSHQAYAVINTHDKNLLNTHGVAADILPNIVFSSTQDIQDPSPARTVPIKTSLCQWFPRHVSDTILKNPHSEYALFTYPVRCIRRKNVIEAGILTVLYEYKYDIPALLCVTLSGTSAPEKPYSDTVQSLFEEGIFSGFFDIGLHLEPHAISYHDVCAASDLILSSSTQEGFGFSFINSVVWGVPLVARAIPVTPDIHAALHPHWPQYWYDALLIPASTLSKETLQDVQRQYEQKLTTILTYYSQDISHAVTDTIHAQIHKVLHSENIDFSFLPLSIQCDIARNIAHDTQYATLLCTHNQHLLTSMHSCMTRHTKIQRSRARSKALKNTLLHYGTSSFRKKFFSLCDTVLHGTSTVVADPEYTAMSIQKAFLTLDNMRVLYD